jgi:hypothetical protein
MKIIRLRNGYRISLSDGEFEALVTLAGHGQADAEGTTLDDAFPGLSRAGKRAMNGRLMEQGAFAIDEDRRDAEE